MIEPSSIRAYSTTGPKPVGCRLDGPHDGTTEEEEIKGWSRAHQRGIVAGAETAPPPQLQRGELATEEVVENVLEQVPDGDAA